MGAGRVEGYKYAKEEFNKAIDAMRADTGSKKIGTTDSSTQMVPKTSTTTSIGAQTYPTSMLPTTRNGCTQTDPTSTHTSPPQPLQPVTSSLPSLTQLPSPLPTLTTTVTNVAPTAPIRRPTPQKRRHSLPNSLSTPHLNPQPPVECPKPSCSIVTSLPTLIGLPVITMLQTTTQATVGAQTTLATSETMYKTANIVQEPSDVGKTRVLELCDDEHRCVSRRVVHPA
jgi:hypothetical protein